MKTLAIAFLLCLPLHSATYLRYGSAATRKDVVSVSTGSACQLGVTGHGYANQAIIYVQGVTGILSSSGPLAYGLAAEVKNATTDTFTLAVIGTHVDISCVGTWRSPSGYVGQARLTTLVGPPGGYLDGPSGALTLSLPSKAVPGWAPYDALLTRAGYNNTPPYSDSVYYTSAHTLEGWSSIIAALAWKTTGTTSYLDQVKYFLNHVEDLGHWRNKFYCDENDPDCATSTGSNLDWGAVDAANFALAFAKIPDQLSGAERSVFADKMLNGYWNDSCTPIPSAVTPWSQGSNHCGALWWIGHHAYQPRSMVPGATTTLAASMDASQTTMTMNRARDIPFFPVYAKIGTEYVRVDSAGSGDVVNITRGAYSSTPASHANNSSVAWAPSKYGKSGTLANTLPQLPGDNVNYDESYHNLVFAKEWAGFTVGIALAPYDSRAEALLERVWNRWFDITYYNTRSFWTGINQGGGAYGKDRWGEWSTHIVEIAKSNFSPSIDLTGDNWLADYMSWDVYWHWPSASSTKKQAPWGDAGRDPVVPGRRIKGSITASGLLPGNSLTPYYNYWLQTFSGYFNSTSIAGETQQPAVFFLHTNPGDTQTNISGLPKYRFYNTTNTSKAGFEGFAFNAAVSRTGWDPTDTAIVAWALSGPQDHTGSYPGPGHYTMLINNQAMVGANTIGNAFGSGSATLSNNTTCRPNFGLGQTGATTTALTVTANGTYPGVAGTSGQYNTIDRKKGTDNYTYWRVNATGAWNNKAAVSRYHREFLHFRTAGSQNYLLIHDSMGLSTARNIDCNWRFPTYTDSGVTVGNTQGLVGTTHTFTRGSMARLTTKVLLPAGATLATSSVTDGFTLNVDAGSTTGANFLVVQRPSVNVSDSLPNTEPISSISATYEGAEINDATQCRIAVFPKNPTISQVGVTFTPAICSGSAEVIAVGLDSGTYDATVGGTPVVDDSVVDAGGVLRFTKSTSGEIVIVQSGAALPLGITSAATLPQGELDTTYNFAFTAEGGTPPYTWDLSSGSFQTGLTLNADGTLTGTPSASGVATPTVRVIDSNMDPATLPVSLTVPAAPSNVAISPQPPTIQMTVGIAYSQQFSCAGGADPHVASAVGTLPTGLSFSSGALLSGTPTSASLGDFPVTLRCTDDDAAVAEFATTIQVRANSSGTIQILSAQAFNDIVSFRLRLPELDANQECSAAIRDENTSEVIFGPQSVPRGPATRTVVMVGVPNPVDQNRIISVACDSDSGSYTVGYTMLTGTTPLTVMLNGEKAGANNVIVDYGTTDALGSTTSSTPCSASCEVSIPDLNRGTLYYIRHTFRDGSNNTLAVSPIRTVIVR